MRGKDLLYMLSEIDSDLIEQAENVRVPKRRISYAKYISIAACAVIAVSAAGYAFARGYLLPHENIGNNTDPHGDSAVTTEIPDDDSHTQPTDPDPLPDDTDPSGPISPGIDEPAPSFDPDVDEPSPATGGAFSYKELTEDMYNFGKAYGLVRLEIIKSFTPDEAAEITGNPAFLEPDPDATDTDAPRTLLSARITYDYLNQRDMSMEILLCLFPEVCGKTSADEHIAVLSDISDFGYYIPDMLFDVYDVGGVDTAFQRGSKWISLADGLKSGLVKGDYPNLDLTMTAEDAEHYTHKMTVADLAGFIREDWALRGIDFKGFDQPDTDNSEIRRQRFLYHDVKLTEYRAGFNAEADFLGNYDLADISAELLKDKPGLRLIEFEVTAVHTDEESAAISGRTDGTLYTLRVLKDFTEENALGEITLWHCGNGSEQYRGYPVWAEGERLITAVYESGEGYYLPVYELEFALMESPIDGEVYAYDIDEGPVYFDSLGLPQGVAEIEYRWQTTTDNNDRLAGGRFDPHELASAIAEIINQN